jgi:hypothetical protein
MMRMREIGVPDPPYIVREAVLQIGFRREYKSGTSRSSLHSTGHVYSYSSTPPL